MRDLEALIVAWKATVLQESQQDKINRWTTLFLKQTLTGQSFSPFWGTGGVKARANALTYSPFLAVVTCGINCFTFAAGGSCLSWAQSYWFITEELFEAAPVSGWLHCRASSWDRLQGPKTCNRNNHINACIWSWPVHALVTVQHPAASAVH